METPERNVHKIQLSVDRARSQAHRLLHKSTAELRKLQSERQKQPEAQATPTDSAVQVLDGELTTVNSEPAPLGSHCKTVIAPPVPGRNSQCPCGSGQKYKRCCARLTWETPQQRAA